MEIELKVSSRVSIPMREIQLQAIRSQGAGGQNVNKVATAVHLFFDIRASSLPEVYKQRLLERKDRRISPAGTVIIKSQESRTQEANREKSLGAIKGVDQGSDAGEQGKESHPSHPGFQGTAFAS